MQLIKLAGMDLCLRIHQLRRVSSARVELLVPKCVDLFEFQDGQLDAVVWPGHCVAGIVEAGATGGVICRAPVQRVH